ncbi:MAG TPA: DUF5946 family protein [Gemmatimonadaceae bacterium]
MACVPSHPRSLREGAIPGASEQAAYDELQCYTLALNDVAFIHQHVVDAWAAQHADEGIKPIALTFALVGLHLHLEKGYSGRQVQRAHMSLAKHRRQWPSLAQPLERGAVTTVQVMSAAPGTERAEAIDAWCASVWDAYRDCHEEVADVVRRHGIG